jgi:hypothetical protein
MFENWSAMLTLLSCSSCSTDVLVTVQKLCTPSSAMNPGSCWLPCVGSALDQQIGCLNSFGPLQTLTSIPHTSSDTKKNTARLRSVQQCWMRVRGARALVCCDECVQLVLDFLCMAGTPTTKLAPLYATGIRTNVCRLWRALI